MRLLKLGSQEPLAPETERLRDAAVGTSEERREPLSVGPPNSIVLKRRRQADGAISVTRIGNSRAVVAGTSRGNR